MLVLALLRKWFQRRAARRPAFRGLKRKQIPADSQTMPTLCYGIQRNRLRFVERSDRKTTQLDNVANRSERDGEISGEGPNVGPLADDRLADDAAETMLAALRFRDTM